MLNPPMGVIFPTAQANSPAAATPHTHPRAAHRVLREHPVSISSEATAVRAHTATAQGMEGSPRKMAGMSRNQIPASV